MFLAAVAGAVVIIGTGSFGLTVQRAAADPARVLTLAGRAAAKQPDIVPRADQYWYVAEDGGYQAWLSMDGTHDGLVISNGERIVVPGCRDGKQTALPDPSRQVPCIADPAYLPDAPEDGTAMKRYLSKRLGRDQGPNQVGKQMLSLLEFHYLRPGARAALFQAAGSIPGVQLRSAGSAGLSANQVAVGWTHADGDTSLVFDARSDAFVGVMTNTASGSTSAGSSASGFAAPSLAIVDRVQQLP